MSEPCPPPNDGPSDPCSASQGKLAAERGRYRARGYYPSGPCQECGAPGNQRVHLDRDPTNNAPDNVRVRCPRCAYTLDGRAAALAEAGRRWWAERRAKRAALGLDRCVHCGAQSDRLKRSMCDACYEYQRTHGGKYRPLREKRVCTHCRTLAPDSKCTHGLCMACYYYTRRHNGELPPQELLDRRGNRATRPSEGGENAPSDGSGGPVQRGAEPHRPR